MATYLQGVTDYIPQVQPFSPDFNFYAKSLQFSQGKADAARKQLSNIYGSLLNAPLSREDNSEARDKFFKTVDQDIQKMAGMDLSLQQNVSAAKGVFNQMLDNKAIVKDMVWTKQHQGQQKKSQSFKNCIDPEKCGGAWWEGGDRALQYNKQEFINASPEDAMSMGVKSYVPYQDVTKRALELAKEADLNVSVDQITGQWITTTKNGPQLIGKQLQDLFMGSIGKDPKVKEYYQTKASNQRKDFMYGNEAQYGSLEGAEQAYLQKLTPALEQYYGKKTVELEDTVTNHEKKIAKIDRAMANAAPDKRTKMQKLRDEFQSRGQLYQSSLEEAKEGQGQVEVAQRNQQYSGRQADAMVAGMDLHNEIGKAAQVMSYRNYESSVAVNPYGMESVKQKNRFMLEKMKHHNQMELAWYKEKVAGDFEALAATGSSESNNGEVITDVVGASSVGNLDSESHDFKNRKLIAFQKDREPVRIDISGNEKNVIDNVMSMTKGAAEGGDIQAKEDYVNMFNTYSAAVNSNAESTEGQTREDLIDNYSINVKLGSLRKSLKKATTIDQKYALIKDYKADWKHLSGGQVDQYYEKGVLPMLQRGKGNEVLRDYLAPVWHNNRKAMQAIETKGKGLELMDKWVADQAKDVVSSAGSANEYSPKVLDALESYIDDKGHVNDLKTFVTNMAGKGWSEDQAMEVYRGDVEDPTGPNAIRIAWNAWTGDWKEADALKKQAKQAETRGIHNVWKEAFTRYAEPDGDQGWLGITGAGDEAAMGLRYSSVDPAQYRSIANMGVNGALKDALNNKEAIFSYGGFASTLPTDNPDQLAVRNLARQLSIDWGTMTNPKSDSRPMLDVTSVAIAGSNPDYMGVNIKMSERYRAKYKGTAADPASGLMGNKLLSSEGFTMYIPKDKATNLFHTGAQETIYEKTMKWTGKVEFNQHPDHFKDMKLTSSGVDGHYKFSGYAQAGLDENGKGRWDYIEVSNPYNTDLNVLIDEYNARLNLLAQKNEVAERDFVLNAQQNQ